MSDLTRVTVNLSLEATRALAVLGGGTTVRINLALRLMGALRPMTAEDGSITVVGPDGEHVRIYVL